MVTIINPFIFTQAPIPQIIAVNVSGANNPVVVFDIPVTASNGSSGDASFDIDGNFYQGVFQLDATHISVSFGATFVGGETWTLNTTTPSWITSGPVQSGSGLTTFVGDITSNLEVWLTLDDGSGSTATDSSGHGYNGTLISSPTWIAGKIGSNALSFNGSNYVDLVSTSGVLDNPTALTVAYWMRSSTAGSVEDLVDKLEDYAIGAGWSAGIYASSVSFLYQSAGGADWYQRFAGAPIDGTWHHVIVTYQHPNIITIYLDSVSQSLSDGSSGTPVSSASSATDILLGGTTGVFTSFYTGDLDDVRIYSRIFNQDDVNLLFAYT